jgi:hypothetical protein
MKLCSPQGHARPLSIGAAARPQKLDGLRIGLLDNTKAPVDKMMAHIAGKLRERFPGVEIYPASKKVASLPAEPQVLQGLRQNCDVVINALGD